MSPYLVLMRLHKPIGLLLLLWPTLWALWLATHAHPDPMIVSVFIAGVLLMRSAGCVINDIFDRQYDPLVARTRLRPLATGQLSTAQALLTFTVLMLLSACTLFFLNPFTQALALVGAGLAVTYPLLKRFTHLPQLGLGVAFSWGIPMAFTACQDSLPWQAVWLLTAAFCWTVMYDTQYAMVDRQDDLKAGVRSTAILFGKQDRLILCLLQLVTVGCLIQVGRVFQLHAGFYVSVLLAGLLFIYQCWLIRDREPDRCFQAFMNNHWVGLVIFIGITWH